MSSPKLSSLTATEQLQYILRHEAGRVWHERARAQKFGFHLNEETTTETTLLRLASRKTGRLAIRAFTKNEEKDNGADWEWCFQQGPRSVQFRVQAKRLFPDGKYRSLKTPARGPSQTRKLINKSPPCYPLYVFFSDSIGVSAAGGTSVLPVCDCGPFHMPSYWGCAVASAYDVQRVWKNKLADLLGVMSPWHCLAEPWGAKALSLPQVVVKNANRMFGDNNGHTVATTKPPSWAEALQDPHSSEQALYTYLRTHELNGIVLFEDKG